jgi:hypothetical protein
MDAIPLEDLPFAIFGTLMIVRRRIWARAIARRDRFWFDTNSDESRIAWWLAGCGILLVMGSASCSLLSIAA